MSNIDIGIDVDEGVFGQALHNLTPGKDSIRLSI